MYSTALVMIHFIRECREKKLNQEVSYLVFYSNLCYSISSRMRKHCSLLDPFFLLFFGIENRECEGEGWCNYSTFLEYHVAFTRETPTNHVMINFGHDHLCSIVERQEVTHNICVAVIHLLEVSRKQCHMVLQEY